ncbi:MAG: DUF128 domain-containing protein [bacterium]
MKIETDQNIVAILSVLKGAQKPLGGATISEKIQCFGIHLSPRTVRYYLALTDKAGFTKNYGNRLGRMITPKGKKEVDDAFVIKKIGLVSSRIDALSYKMQFSLSDLSGDIVLNVTTISPEDLKKAKGCMRIVFQKGLGMGQLLIFGKQDSCLGNFSIPSGKIAIGTVCSITINGLFLNAGIPVFSRFGGLLEMRRGRPVGFTEIIKYGCSTVDPLEIFINSHMTNVTEAANSGNGIICASFREIPDIAIPEAIRIKNRLMEIGLDGILLIGNPRQSLFDIPVPQGRAPMILIGGLNPIAACVENGIKTQNFAMKTLCEFKKLVPYNQCEKGSEGL